MQKMRYASIALFICGSALTILVASWHIGAVQESAAEVGCGLGVFLIYIAAAAALVICSLISTVLNGLAFRALPTPRPGLRKLELAVMALPLTLAVVGFTVALIESLVDWMTRLWGEFVLTAARPAKTLPNQSHCASGVPCRRGG